MLGGRRHGRGGRVYGGVWRLGAGSAGGVAREAAAAMAA